MNNKGVALAAFFALSLIILAGFAYLNMLQFNAKYHNQEPARPAFEIIRATTLAKNNQAFLEIAGAYAIQKAITTLTRENPTECKTITYDQKKYIVLTKECFTKKKIADKLSTLFSEELSIYLAAYNEKEKKQGLWIPNNYAYAVLIEPEKTIIQAIALDTAKIPIITPAQDYTPLNIQYAGYTIPFPTTNLIPPHLSKPIESELSYKQIGYITYKPSVQAEVPISLNEFVTVYTEAVQLVQICTTSIECLKTSIAKHWTVTSENNSLLFNVPIANIDNNSVEFLFVLPNS